VGSNPINLAVRFILELAALFALGSWAWQQGESLWLRVLFTFLVVLVAAVLWGTFAVPDDPSRSGAAPVPVPGWVRLLLELAILGAGVWAVFTVGRSTWGWVFGGLVLVHYLVSYDRVLWLLKQ